jgi:hypothetical protein
MRMSECVEVWNRDKEWAGEGTHIGVNWSAIGPVTPAQARTFARHVLTCADKAGQAIIAAGNRNSLP